MNKIDGYNYLKNFSQCQHYHTIHKDQLIDDDIQTRFFKRRIHQSNLPEKGPFKHDKENRVFVQSTIWRIFEWLLFLGNNIPQLFTKVSSLGAKLHAFVFDFWSFALAFEKYANKLIKTAKLYSTPHTLKAVTI